MELVLFGVMKIASINLLEFDWFGFLYSISSGNVLQKLCVVDYLMGLFLGKKNVINGHKVEMR